MFPFFSLPKQWEKKLVRYLLHRLDLLEERTLGDLSNLEGSIGKNSTFVLKDVGIKVERLRHLIKIPQRFSLTKAVVGTLTINLPANLFYSGSVEILINDVKVALELSPPPKDDDRGSASPSPPSTPRPGDVPRSLSSEGAGFPHTAEDLAQSFIEAQSEAEKQQLMSLYAENTMSSSFSSAASTASLEDDDEEVGVGTGMGLPGVLASVFNGIADRMIVRVRGARASLEITLSEERGGEKVLLQVEVEDVDIEGVSRNAQATTLKEAQEKPQKEGKRRITLENIRGWITADAGMFGPPSSPAESTVFETTSEASTERGGDAEDIPAASSSAERSVETIRDLEVEPPAPPRSAPPAMSVPPPHHTQSADMSDEDDMRESDTSDGDKFMDYDESDEEVLAFAPSGTLPRSSLRHSFARRHLPSSIIDNDSSDDDSDDDVEGGATFAQHIPHASIPIPLIMSDSTSFTASPESSTSPSTFEQSPPLPPPPRITTQSPPRSAALPRSPQSPRSPRSARSSLASLRPPVLQSQPSNLSDPDSSGDEMDPEASHLLSQSSIFSREEAESLYMSARGSVLRSKSELRLQREQEAREEAEDEEIDAEEMDQRLDKLINGETSYSDISSSLPLPASSSHRLKQLRSPRSPRKLRRQCLNVDRVTIYYPSLSAGVVAVDREDIQSPASPPPQPRPSTPLESRYGQMPGAFSMYASRHSSSPGKQFTACPPPLPSSPVQHRPPPRVKIVDAKDARPTAPSLDHLLGDKGPGKNADIEIIASNIHGIVDIKTEKILGQVLEAVQNAIQDVQDEAPRKQKSKTSTDGEPKKSVQIIAEEIDVRLIKRLRGIFTDTGEGDEGDDTIQLHCQLNDVKIHHKGLPDEASTNRLSVKKFSLKDQEEGIITFLPFTPTATPAAKMSMTSHHRRRSSTSAPSGGLPVIDDDIVVIFSQSQRKTRVNIQTLPLRIRGDLKRLEETFSAFGGVGSVLASTSSTATITKAGKPPPWHPHNSLHDSGVVVDTKVDCRIGGLLFDVVGSTATVNVEASPIKIKFQTGSGVNIGIEKIEISGPSLEQKDAKLVIDGSKMEFASHPTQEDLSRLLELLTPSKDRFDDDDILIETLLRQREQGSVFRVNVAGVRGELLDMSIFDRLKELGDEVIKVLTVTDFVAGDERPGVLTLVNVEGVYAYAEMPGGMGRVEAEMDSLGITHVSAPSLFALAIGTTSVRRNDLEELLGEGMTRKMFSAAEVDRPMIMVRMVGDEPEPVVKIKLWNIRLEYHVETLLALMEAPKGTTGEEIAQDMVKSIAGLNLSQHQGPRKSPSSDEIVALGFDVVVKDSVLALNPLDLKSKGLIILTDARIQAALPNGEPIRAGMEIKKASVMIVDDTGHLISPDRIQTRSRRDVLSDHLSAFASMGYVPVITISTAQAHLQVVDKAVDLDIRDDLLLIESCADSTQTLLAIVNGLKPPPPEEEEIKYCTEVIPINMLESLEEDAFVHPVRKQAANAEDEEDLMQFSKDSLPPASLAFQDSYYGHKPSDSPPELTDSMLEDDLTELRYPPTFKRQGSSAFKDGMEIFVDEPLKIVDEYFAQDPKKRRGKRALNQEAVDRAEYFPLRVKIRDAHVLWNLHDGYDWQRTRDTISNAVHKVESRAAERRNRRVSFDLDDDDEDSIVDDFLFNSIYIGIPANRDPKELTNDINKHFDDHMSETSYATSSRSTATYHHDHHRGKKALKLNRSRHHKMQFEIKGVNVDFLLFPPDSGEEVQSSVEVRCRDLEIFDNVPTSTWRKFVTYCQDCGERELGSDMVRLECMIVKPVPELAATEMVIKVNILPLRLHVDQDTLDFLTRFFEFKDDATNIPSSRSPQSEEPFLQRVEINSVKVKLDYKPKKVDYAGLRSGHTTEFMNFFILEEANMVMRRVVLHGISGFERMSKILNDTWMPDIKTTQLGDVLSGVAPVRSLVNLGKSAKDLVVVPVREYRKDGRVVRSLQKGVGGFVRNTAGELVRLGAKVAVGTQTLLQSAIPNDSSGGVIVEIGEDGDTETERVVSLYADQPETITQGLRTASRALQRNFHEARDAIMNVPEDAAQRGPVQAVVRAAPVAVLRPMVGVTEAVSRTLMGVGNAMEPERRRGREDKYKKR